MNVPRTLRDMCKRLERYAEEMEAGHVVASDDLRNEARRLLAQAEGMDEGLAA